MNETTPPKRSRKRPQPKQNQESFLSGLFSLMVKQCIFSAMIFGALYYAKNSGLPFSEPVCTFIKDAVGYEVTTETIRNLTAGILG